jgi:hypothetical protein
MRIELNARVALRKKGCPAAAPNMQRRPHRFQASQRHGADADTAARLGRRQQARPCSGWALQGLVVAAGNGVRSYSTTVNDTDRLIGSKEPSGRLHSAVDSSAATTGVLTCHVFEFSRWTSTSRPPTEGCDGSPR